MNTGAQLADNLFRPLSKPLEAWHFDMGSPPQESARRTLDVEFTETGRFNAVVFWFELQLGPGIKISTEPGCSACLPPLITFVEDGSLTAGGHMRQTMCLQSGAHHHGFRHQLA